MEEMFLPGLPDINLEEEAVRKFALSYLQKMAKNQGTVSIKTINEAYKLTGAFSYKQLHGIFGSVVRMRRIARAKIPKGAWKKMPRRRKKVLRR